MRSKAPLTLMEQIIMILVFALAAALCLRAFAGARQTSKDTAALDRAVLEAQNAAETLKGCGGDYEKAAALYGGSWDGQSWVIYHDSYTLQATPQSSETHLLGRAEITVTDDEGTLLYSLTTAWQKEGGSHG